MWQKNILPSEFDKMPYYEFEEYIKMMNDRNKEENDKQKQQNDQQQSQQQQSMPKMPNFGNFKPPSMPKF